METGLFEIEADYLSAIGTAPQMLPTPSRDVVYALFSSDARRSDGRSAGGPQKTITSEMSPRFQSLDEEPAADPGRHLAQCFLRLANLPTCPLDRLSRYEYALWRQVAQILVALDNLNRRKPQERKSRLFDHTGRGPSPSDQRFGDD